MLADYYWILTTEATGSARKAEEYKNIYYYADFVTDLDPKFRYVYVFTGVMIPHNKGRETWVNTVESTKILEKGLQFFPEYAYLRVILAYNYSYFHGYLRRAADLLSETRQLPGAPSYIGSLATRLYAQAGATDTGLALASILLDSANDPETRQAFERRKKELLLERILQQVDKAIEKYRQREGQNPSNILQLVARNDLPELPVDPLGGTVVVGTDGRSHSSEAPDARLEVFDPRKQLSQN
jgi:hypothetical protein